MTAKPCSLVTGGAGFIGSHVAAHCLELNHEVVILDDLSGGFRDYVPKGVHFVQGSVTNTELVARLFQDHMFDFVYHLAAYAAEGLSHFIRRFNYTTNLVGSVNLINEAVKHRVRCFVFTSSIAVYGAGQVPMTEDLVPLPEDPYGISKYAVELDLEAARQMWGLNYIIFRPHNVYGEHQNIGDRYRNVIGIFMNQVMSNEPMTVFGDGSQTRAFSYIDDVAPLISCSVQVESAYNDTFNIGADTPYSVNQLARTIAGAFNIDAHISYLPARHEVQHAYASHDKARRIFGAVPAVDLETGISRMADWALRVGSRRSRSFGAIEVLEGMPPSWLDQS